VCREGYSQQPQSLLALYCFSRRVRVRTAPWPPAVSLNSSSSAALNSSSSAAPPLSPLPPPPPGASGAAAAGMAVSFSSNRFAFQGTSLLSVGKGREGKPSPRKQTQGRSKICSPEVFCMLGELIRSRPCGVATIGGRGRAGVHTASSGGRYGCV
jgi:hypothetical protein